MAGLTSVSSYSASAEWERKALHAIATGATPHFVPDADMLAIQRRRVAAYTAANGAASTALVLGATPELADLALRAGLRLIWVDSSPAMFAAARQRREVAESPDEQSIVANWLAMPVIGAGTIDIVLGDAALNNVAQEDMGAVLDEISRITRPGSLVSLRQIVLPDAPVAHYEFQNALAALRTGRISLHEFDRVVRFYSFNSCALDTERHLLDARKVFEEIRHRHELAELEPDEFDFLMSRFSAVRHTIFNLSEQVAQLTRLGDCAVEMLPPACFFRDLTAVFAVTVR